GVQTTSHVESLNHIIKNVLSSSSTLCDLANAIEEKLKDKAQ
ncbi:27066_t:CDS:1, partial [Racocetra persica]